MGNKKQYEKPTIVNVNGCGVSGDTSGLEPSDQKGYCSSGTAPFYSCTNGPDFLGACGGGGAPDTSYCNTGGAHTIPSCKEGGAAMTGCFSGHGQQ